MHTHTYACIPTCNMSFESCVKLDLIMPTQKCVYIYACMYVCVCNIYIYIYIYMYVCMY